MSLFVSSLTTGISLTILGLLVARSNNKVRSLILGFPRSKRCSFWFVGIATFWFLGRHVAFLSEADFGNYKLLIGSIALGTAILSFVFVSDFLAVRGLAMMILLWSREVLDSAFLHDAGSRLVLVSVIYILIACSIYFGAWPYKMRDFIDWLNQRSVRITSIGWIFTWVGLLIISLSFTY